MLLTAPDLAMGQVRNPHQHSASCIVVGSAYPSDTELPHLTEAAARPGNASGTGS